LRWHHINGLSGYPVHYFEPEVKWRPCPVLALNGHLKDSS